MTPDPYLVQEDMPITRLGELLQQTHHHSFPVVDHDLRLVGMVSIRDYDRGAQQNDSQKWLVRDIATMGRLLIAYEDEPLSDVIQRLAVRGINKMPVVTRENPHRVTGVIRRSDIVKAYNVALARRSKNNIEVEKLPAAPGPKMKFVEIEITPDSQAANCPLVSLAPQLPYDCVVVSVRRQGHLLVPHGDTVLLPGDILTVFVRRLEENQVHQCLGGAKYEKY